MSNTGFIETLKEAKAIALLYVGNRHAAGYAMSALAERHGIKWRIDPNGSGCPHLFSFLDSKGPSAENISAVFDNSIAWLEAEDRRAAKMVEAFKPLATMGGPYTISGKVEQRFSDPPNTITFRSLEHGEILCITPDGFYVRGVKVAQGDGEAQAVYTAFIEWIRSTRHYR